MPRRTIQIPFPPQVLLTLLFTTVLLAVAYLIAPDIVRKALLVCGALMIIVLAFTSMELTLYLVIMSTLLSPELQFGGSETALEKGQIRTTESRGVTLRVDDLLLTLVCLTWLFRMAVDKELGAIRATAINQPIMAYLVVNVISTMFGFMAGRVGGFGFFFVLKFAEYFVLFYMVMNHLHDEAAIKRYLWVMLFTCFVASLYGVAQIPSGERVSAPFEGEIGEPNSFGGYLVLMFSVALGMFLHTRKGPARLMLGALLPIVLVALLFTESRTSYLALLGSMCLFYIFSEYKRLLMFGGLVGLLLAPIVMPRSAVERVMFTFTQSQEAGQIKVGGVKIDTSTSARIDAWKRVIMKEYLKHPVFGVGVTGGFFLDAQYPRVLLETGLLGLLCFLWFLRRVWVLLRRSYRMIADPQLKGAALGALCGFGGLLLHSIGANSFIIVRIMEPFMILLGLILAAQIAEQKKVDASQASVVA